MVCAYANHTPYAHDNASTQCYAAASKRALFRTDDIGDDTLTDDDDTTVDAPDDDEDAAGIVTLPFCVVGRAATADAVTAIVDELVINPAVEADDDNDGNFILPVDAINRNAASACLRNRYRAVRSANSSLAYHVTATLRPHCCT